MKLIKLYFIFCVTFVITSCCKDDKYHEVYNIDINNLSSRADIFSEYYSVPLETSDSVVVANIDKIKVYDSLIVILDKNNNRLFIFDRKGKYVSKIDRFGKGHGEYISIDDFNLQDSVIFILSRASKQLNKYNLNGEFIAQITLNDWYNKFKLIDDGYMWLYSESSNNQKYNFILFNYKYNEYENGFDEFSSTESYGFNSSPFGNGIANSVVVQKPFDYHLYSLQRDSFNIICEFKFNTEYEFKKSNKDNYSNLSETYREKSIVKLISLSTITNNAKYIVYDINIKERGLVTHVSRIGNDGDIKTYRYGDPIEATMPYLRPPLYIYDNYFISYYPAFVLIDLEKYYSTGHLNYPTLKDSDNPILFFYKLK